MPKNDEKEIEELAKAVNFIRSHTPSNDKVVARYWLHPLSSDKVAALEV